MAESLAYKLGRAAYDKSPDEADVWCICYSRKRDKLLEEWGNAIIEELRLRGIYLNQVKGDPSGRW